MRSRAKDLATLLRIVVVLGSVLLILEAAYLTVEAYYLSLQGMLRDDVKTGLQTNVPVVVLVLAGVAWFTWPRKRTP